MNKVVLMGRLTRDPEVRYTNSAEPTTIARYTLAVNRRFTNRNEGNNEQTADFINCVAFGRSAEFAEKYFTKGMQILITGRIQTGSYTNREGKKVYTTDIVVEEQEFTESKNATGNNNTQQQENDGYTDAGDGFMNIPEGIDEELPFN